MKAILRHRATKIVAVAAAVAAVFAGGVAVASSNKALNVVAFTGGSVTSSKVTTDSDGFGPSAFNTYQNVPGSTMSFSVPSGSKRLITARFNAESYCTASNWCVVRIVVRKAGSSTLYEMYPRVGTEFAFDSPDGENYEGNSVNRTLKLSSSGTWYVFAQAMTYGSSGSMYLDDWHFEATSQTTS